MASLAQDIGYTLIRRLVDALIPRQCERRHWLECLHEKSHFRRGIQFQVPLVAYNRNKIYSFTNTLNNINAPTRIFTSNPKQSRQFSCKRCLTKLLICNYKQLTYINKLIIRLVCNVTFSFMSTRLLIRSRVSYRFSVANVVSRWLNGVMSHISNKTSHPRPYYPLRERISGSCCKKKLRTYQFFTKNNSTVFVNWADWKL